MANYTSHNALARWFGNLADAVVSVVFPGGCRLCKQLLTQASRLPICERCLSSFPLLTAEGCKVCGQPWPQATRSAERESQLCGDCQQQKFAFDAARSYGVYEGNLVRGVLLLKYERVEPLGTWFAQRLHEIVESENRQFAADVVIPVPLHREREKERGFNQVDLIACPLAKQLRLPYRRALLMRKRPRPEKHLLRNEERWEAVRGAFAMRDGRQVDNLRVLLVDDVMTTGATLDACARALRDAGAKSVLGLTVARAVRFTKPVGARSQALKDER